MVDISKDAKRFLTELYARTGGDSGATVSMYEVVEADDWSRERSGAAGEELIGWGLVEVRTLSGGVAICESGIEYFKKEEAEKVGEPAAPLGSETVLGDEAREAVDALISRLKIRTETFGLGFEKLAEMIADLKTAGAQLSSPRPKTSVIKEVFRSVLAVLDTVESGGREAEDIRRMMGE